MKPLCRVDHVIVLAAEAHTYDIASVMILMGTCKRHRGREAKRRGTGAGIRNMTAICVKTRYDVISDVVSAVLPHIRTS